MSDETDPDYDFYEYTASYSPSSNSSDVFVLQLIGNNNSGTYNLAGKNYSDDSGAFILVFENSGTTYFQQSGTIRFNSFNSTSGALSAQLNSVKLVEVTIANDGSYTSTPVTNGKCLEIQDTTINVGNNGGNDDPATGCTGLSIDWSSFTYYEDDNIEGYFAYVEFGNTSMSDDFQMQFFQNSNGKISTGTYDLSSGKNANYSTCTECVLAYQDYNESTDKYTKLFFQKSGTLKLPKATTNGAALVGTISAKLIEVTIDPSNDYTSTPVSGGACLEIETGSFNYSGN